MFTALQKLKPFISFITTWSLSFLRIQIIIFLFSLPILSLWGLPLSYASILGNLLFAPWATIFLGLSTLWLISHLCGIPTVPIVYCIERLVQCWLWCLSWGSPRMLFAIPAVHPLLAITIPLSAILLLYSNFRSRWGLHNEVLVLGCMALFWCYGLSTLAITTEAMPIAHGGGTLWLAPSSNGVSLIDKDGVLRASHSSSWTTFTLASTLARHFGVCSCHDIVIHKPTIRRLQAAAALVQAGKGKRIVVPSWVTHKKWWLTWKKNNEGVEIGEL